jgi:hypothetical protein
MPPELMELIKAGGAAIAPIFAVLWWLERQDRTALQGKLDLMTERVIVAMTETKSSLQTFSSLLASPGGRK